MERLSYRPEQPKNLTTPYIPDFPNSPDLPEKKREPSRKKVVQYDVTLDTQDAHSLYMWKYEDRELYEKKKQAFIGSREFNLQTALRERFNAELSRWKVRLVKGELTDVHTGKKLIDVYETGRKRRAEGTADQDPSSQHDLLREQAEVDTQRIVQDVLGHDQTPPGTMVMYASPPGGEDSIYKHTFVDVHTLKEDPKGERYVESVRLSTDLDNFEFAQKLNQLQPGYFKTPEFGTKPIDVYFLSHPITLFPGEQLQTAEQIHKAFQKGYDTMGEREMQQILKTCAPWITAYITILCEDPFDTYRRNEAYNALLNKADEVARRLEIVGVEGYDTLYSEEDQLTVSDEDLAFMGALPVRALDTGCGFSGGLALGGVDSPYSVAAFGFESTGSSWCGDCNSINSDNHYHCPKDTKDKEGTRGCGKLYRDETNLPKAFWTKSCMCGFKFGC